MRACMCVVVCDVRGEFLGWVTVPGFLEYTNADFPLPACFMVDLAFAVDSSGSISGENWTRVTDFFNRVIARMEVNPDCARVSIVTFGSMASLQFDLLVYTDAASLRRGIERLHTHNQTRDFVGAIRQVRSEVFQDYYGDRQGIPNVCVLLTDGNSGADRKVCRYM